MLAALEDQGTAYHKDDFQYRYRYTHPEGSIGQSPVPVQTQGYPQHRSFLRLVSVYSPGREHSLETGARVDLGTAHHGASPSIILTLKENASEPGQGLARGWLTMETSLLGILTRRRHMLEA